MSGTIILADEDMEAIKKIAEEHDLTPEVLTKRILQVGIWYFSHVVPSDKILLTQDANGGPLVEHKPVFDA